MTPDSETIAPAYLSKLEQHAYKLCEKGKIDVDEWGSKWEEWLRHLRCLYREAVEQGMSSEQAYDYAVDNFGSLDEAAKLIRDPWWVRVVFYHRHQPTCLLVIVVFYLFYALQYNPLFVMSPNPWEHIRPDAQMFIAATQVCFLLPGVVLLAWLKKWDVGVASHYPMAFGAVKILAAVSVVYLLRLQFRPFLAVPFMGSKYLLGVDWGQLGSDIHHGHAHWLFWAGTKYESIPSAIIAVPLTLVAVLCLLSYVFNWPDKKRSILAMIPD